MAETTGSEPETHQPGAPKGTKESLWLLTFAPLMWTACFLLSYVTAAIWCAKVAGRNGSLDGAHLAIGVYTVLTLIGIGIVIWRGYRKHRFGRGHFDGGHFGRGHFTGGEAPHDADSASDRHRFLGFATVLIGGLSAVATVYNALTIVFIDSCA